MKNNNRRRRSRRLQNLSVSASTPTPSASKQNDDEKKNDPSEPMNSDDSKSEPEPTLAIDNGQMVVNNIDLVSEEWSEEEDDRSQISDLIVSDSEIDREMQIAEFLEETDNTGGINVSNIIEGKRNRQPATTFYDQYREDLVEVLISDDEQLMEDVDRTSTSSNDPNYDDDEEDDEEYVPSDDVDE